ncbi:MULTISPECIES: deoxyribodipyrimidine photo-lyase [unclassified Undibacterium]|uniref:cryptochrome/photolyase family protein n=1 Tax=unclassified Undibacterium TaxID=2630295 RepID=UPI002AC8EF2E|nr:MULTISPECIES: deoxyribodipyrimidine photo-lyase [unclassified Undibacterium]MEB0137905.1 deoxyribodipyrimidine photo-lyase [Undibacterium sp. CCC2.1]MEB0172025.1 deoxyribodipyrimidine photo-lyase [Undibacterium sp. CCC1.1]MEB0174913.1 deoxyribodipyrimidine photo-lyase [Undibacterium sp. CCC3.4]MEB0214879.1 deoxyribodipyrimidine photo-lyase [Undibacterium sp. 5I2]WPX45360.1 deoxyribodipyrimidine photo-lyase [Undibacterium sp. CCC3.4]
MPSTSPLFDHALVWFRRDLRDFDHAALYHALRQSKAVTGVFIFDQRILAALPQNDRRLAFIHDSVRALQAALAAAGGTLLVRYGDPVSEITALAKQLQCQAVYVNHDYEPSAKARDTAVAAALAQQACALFSFKDQVIFEKEEVRSLAGTPFSVFTPYKNAWLKKLHGHQQDFYTQPYRVDRYAQHYAPALMPDLAALPGLAEMGFAEAQSPSGIPSGMQGGAQLLEDFLPRLARYDQTRNFPAIKGPSYLSMHLRFGTVSIRHLVRTAVEAVRRGSNTGAEVWLSELIWRDFYFMILDHHPHVCERAFKPAYEAIVWEQGPLADTLFQAWCEGKTGYPLVDAAMLQLNQTGYMHNRLRMVTACFLIKDLGIDWRRGEAYFALHLNDFDLSANNGGWQWAASTGCDAQPYFRIFNPIMQSEKFDADGKFIARYLPHLAGLDKRSIHAPWKAAPLLLQQAGVRLGDNYPYPVVEHDAARHATLARYAVVKQAGVPELD